MPAPYSSWLTAVQAKYASLTAANFPGGAVPPGPFLDKAPTMKNATTRISPPYVLIFDLGGDQKWTFTSDQANVPGQNGIENGGFRIECYAFGQGDADRILAAILWNGQIPDRRAGIGFMNLDLVSPQKGIDACVIPTKNQRGDAGFQYNNELVYVARQWFTTKIAISGAG